MIHIKNLSLTFCSQTVFDDISINIDQNARMGLVGRNGSGKSTLLKVIAKRQSAESGLITILPGKKIAYMPQEVVLQSDKSIIDETVSACADIDEIQRQIKNFEKEIEQGNTHDSIITPYIDLQEQLALLEPEKILAQAEQMLIGLGFKREQLEQPVNSLSVGWKMRVVLAKLLLQKADFYLFDEPTNHLDIVAKDWFLAFLKESDFGFLLVCHERYFLDELCTSILALEYGHAKVYKGNYSNFEAQYAQDLEQLQSAHARQQKELERRAETIERFKAKASKAKMAQSMQKQLDKIERITLPPAPKTVRFHFPETKRSGKIVLSVKDVSQKFGEKKLFEHVDMQIERGERVALVAANGVGKTTLFNLIVGKLPLQHGTIEFGSNVDQTIFAQDQNESLDFNANIFENAKALCPKKSEQQIRAFLGAFLFGAEEIKKKVGVLSGGEKNRVAMSVVLMQDANFLLLDEPTNHLDMPSKEILIQALSEFTGTILFVSHDHYFINKLATRVVELTTKGAFSYQGNYDAYLHQKSLLAPIVAPTKKSEASAVKQTPKVENRSDDENKRARKLEHDIAHAEKEIEKLQRMLGHEEVGSHAYNQTLRKIERKQLERKTAFDEWETLAS
jgi:ATP-binding cassette subfamily F protein 3